MSIIFDDRGICLDTYEKWREVIGPFECNGKLIDSDTTVVLERRDEEFRKKIMNGKVVYVTIWYCVVGIHCKCGEYHYVTSDIPLEEQVAKLVDKACFSGYGLISGLDRDITLSELKNPLLVYMPLVEEVEDYNPKYTYELSDELTDENEF